MASYPPDLEEYVEQKVQSGEFRSRDDFAAEAARLYRELEERHRALKSDISAALGEAKQGESEPLDLEALGQELRDELDEQGNPR
jgi:Arc/MetJ-type ribon-helix-helix transcriptional regulator